MTKKLFSWPSKLSHKYTYFVLCTHYNIVEQEEMSQFPVTFYQLNNKRVANQMPLGTILGLKIRHS